MDEIQIGAWFLFVGENPAYLKDQPVLLCGVRKAWANEDSDEADIRHDVNLAKVGGMEVGDRAFIKMWLQAKQRPSWIEDECAASDLQPLPQEQWPDRNPQPLITYHAVDTDDNVLATIEAYNVKRAETRLSEWLLMPDKRPQYAAWAKANYKIQPMPACDCAV